MIELLMKWKRLQEITSENLFGGPKHLKIAWVINTEKYAAILSFAFLMWYYENFSQACWIYLGLHTGYSLGWIMKHYAYPDKSWEVKVTYGGALFIWFGAIGWYLVMGWVLASRTTTADYPISSEAWLALSVAVCLIGSVLMLAADAQKSFCLKHKPQLIDFGLFRHIRHPNYLGEMIIYSSFAMVVWHWSAIAILVYIWLAVFLPNLIAIEKSISRYPGWEDYKKRSWAVLPFIF